MIHRHWYIALLVALPVPGLAWTFSAPINVMSLHQPRTYVHLESSGNRSLAIAANRVAVVWEDNHSGQPQVYVAFKSLDGSRFTPPLQVSDAGPAYEPALAGLADGRFVVVWEAGDRIWSRIVSPRGRGKVTAVTASTARQATISSAADGRLWLAWSQQAGAHFRILAASGSVKDERLHILAASPVDPAMPKQDQQYPSLALTRDGTSIAWEDRRYGHTRIFTAFAPRGKAFSPLQQLNELKRSRSSVYGNGTGAMRPVLAGNGGLALVACWLDKRNFTEGYDVYAAFSHDGGRHFGKNQKVEDMLGANQAQWHAVASLDRNGRAVVAWDDQRDGSPDIWYSEYDAKSWADNDSPRGASGDGAQTHPALAFDGQGRLHLVFLDSGQSGVRIRYLLASPPGL